MAQVPEPDRRPMKLNHLRDLTVESPLASGHAFVSAASGIVSGPIRSSPANGMRHLAE